MKKIAQSGLKINMDCLWFRQGKKKEREKSTTKCLELLDAIKQNKTITFFFQLDNLLTKRKVKDRFFK